MADDIKKKTILLLTLFIVPTLFSNVNALGYTWANTNYDSRNYFEINLTSGTDNNLQYEINISYADIPSGYGNFTDWIAYRQNATNYEQIDYWINENLTVDSSHAYVTFEADYVDDGGDEYIVLYYNGNITNGSNGTATFVIFDDFNDNDITDYSGDTGSFSTTSGTVFEGGYALNRSGAAAHKHIQKALADGDYEALVYMHQTSDKKTGIGYGLTGDNVYSIYPDDASNKYGLVHWDNNVFKKYIPNADMTNTTAGYSEMLLRYSGTTLYAEQREWDSLDTIVSVVNASVTMTIDAIVFQGYSQNTIFDVLRVKKYNANAGQGILLGEENRSATRISVTSPANTTYASSPNMSFYLYDTSNATFHVKYWLDSVLFYDNASYINATVITNSTTYFSEGGHNLTIWGNGSSSVSQTIIFTVDETEPTIDIFNYTFYNGFRANITELFWYNIQDNIDSSMVCNITAGTNAWSSESVANNTNSTHDYNVTAPQTIINFSCMDNAGNIGTENVTFTTAFGNTTVYDEETRGLFNLTNHNVTLFILLEDRAYSILNVTSNYNYYTVNGTVTLIRAIVDNSYYRSVFEDDDSNTEIYVYDELTYPSSQIDTTIETPYSSYVRVTRLYEGGELIIHEQYPVGSAQEVTLYLMNNRPYNYYVYPNGIQNRLLEITPTGADEIALTIPDVSLDIVNIMTGYVQFNAIAGSGNEYTLQAVIAMSGEYTVNIYDENSTLITTATATGNSVTNQVVNASLNGSFFELEVNQDSSRITRFVAVPSTFTLTSFSWGTLGTSGTYNMDMTLIGLILPFATLMMFGFIAIYPLGFVIAGVESIIAQAFFNAHPIIYWIGWTYIAIGVILYVRGSGLWK